MTADLIAFLRARLDEDEAVAATPEAWTAFEEDESTGTRRVDVDHSFERVVACTRAWRGVHIARHDPARVLAEVEAKRQIVGLHFVIGGWEDEDGHDRGLGCECCGHSEEYSDRGGWCETLRLLALSYADHPDYRDAWRP
ncbi:DUF6221 family protein [Streptomyces albidoflavus]